jgi:DNA-binding transcriptional LysR family regulator
MSKDGLEADFFSDKTLMLYEGGNTRRTIDDWFASAGLRLKPAMEFGSVEAVKELVAAGLGWSLLPGLALQRDRSDYLATSPLKPRLVRQLGMVMRRDKHLTKGLREVVNCLRAFRN